MGFLVSHYWIKSAIGLEVVDIVASTCSAITTTLQLKGGVGCVKLSLMHDQGGLYFVIKPSEDQNCNLFWRVSSGLTWTSTVSGYLLRPWTFCSDRGWFYVTRDSFTSFSPSWMWISYYLLLLTMYMSMQVGCLGWCLETLRINILNSPLRWWATRLSVAGIMASSGHVNWWRKLICFALSHRKLIVPKIRTNWPLFRQSKLIFGHLLATWKGLQSIYGKAECPMI